MQTEVDELAVNLQLQRGYNHTVISISSEELSA